MSAREIVVMITSSYPRYPGDTIGTFMEPIARGVAASGHEDHLVLPWHPTLRRASVEDGVHFHVFRYAPVRSLNVFGYAGALKADVRLRPAAYLVAPLALASAWRTARRVARAAGATVVHGHWLLPSGAVATAVAGSRPVVISLHGSDVYVAERQPVARRVARLALQRAGWITACSDDLRDRAIRLGASPDRIVTVPYGVDAVRFKPDAAVRAAVRQRHGVGDSQPVLLTAGRFARKKGFEYLIDAAALLRATWPRLQVWIAGGGDLEAEPRARVASHGIADRVRFVGILSQDQVADHLAAADVAVVPSVRDDAGNVDGLPNTVLESLASGTPVVATTAGGIGSVVTHERTGLLVAERDASGLAAAVDRLLADRILAKAIGHAARQESVDRRGWDRVAERFEEAYVLARRARA
jgi:glycosyltransferase involved in cell wall biosynthesis